MPVKVEISNNIKIQGLPKEEVDWLTEQLTLTNPHFAKKKAMGLSIWGVPQYKKYYSREAPKTLVVPIGVLDYVLNHNPVVTDNRTTNSFKKKYTFNGTLYPYQKKFVAAAMSHGQGIIKAKTGSGKTICFINLFIQRKQTTLIVMHLKDLINQTKASLLKFTDIPKEDIGRIIGKKIELKPITFVTLQTLNAIVKKRPKDLEIINNYFGQVFADETHVIAAETFYNAMNSLKCKYRYGFSATPRRDDGLTKLIYFSCGNLIHSVPDKYADAKLIKPNYKQIETNFYFPLFNTNEYQDMITYLSSDEERNELILEVFNTCPEEYCMFLCERVDQVEWFHSKISGSVMITADTPTKEREEIRSGLVSKKYKVGIATTAIFSTGIDIPHLQALFICAPFKSYNKVKQVGGRVMRQAAGKSYAVIYDFVDQLIPLLAKHADKRAKLLTTL